MNGPEIVVPLFVPEGGKKKVMRGTHQFLVFPSDPVAVEGGGDSKREREREKKR